MSLDVYLVGRPETGYTGIFVREDGRTREITRAEWDERFPGLEPVTAEASGDYLYEANITHNLGGMAKMAGIYLHLWRPEELGIKTAGELIEPLAIGLAKLRASPDTFSPFNPSNGWGNYDTLMQFVTKYLEACQEHPAAIIHVSR